MNRYYQISFVERAAYHYAIKKIFFGLRVNSEIYSEIVLGEMVVRSLVSGEKLADEFTLVLEHVDGDHVYVAL